MKNARFWLGDALICLPLLVLIAGGIFFFRAALPGLVAREAARVRSVYHEVAAEIKDGEALAVRQYERGERKAEGRLGKGSWGVEDHGREQLVWYRPPHSPTVSGVMVPTVESFDYERFFQLVGLAVLVLMLILTDVGLRYFRRFSRERDDFMAAAVHDLRTPLVGMRRLIGRNDAEARQLAERMLHLVENISDFLKLGARRPPDIRRVAVLEAFAETYRLFAADYAELASGPLTVVGDGALAVRADEHRLVQIFWNLIGNELKYAAPYGPVTATFRADDRQVVMELADEGPGMTAAERRRAFERYYRARTISKSGKGGFGIGLCTAREFAREIGGELTVRANVPRGCVFTLVLPRATESEERS